MRDYDLEREVLWNRAQTEERLIELEDSLVDLTLVLARFTPDHIHLRKNDMPLRFRLAWPLRHSDTFRSLFRTAFEDYFEKQGLPGMYTPYTYHSKEGCIWPPEKTLRFKEIDFTVCGRNRIYENLNVFINTTRVEGSRSIYQVFIPNRPSNVLLYESGQQLITAMLAVRV